MQVHVDEPRRVVPSRLCEAAARENDGEGGY
jgi:hypothetical protein